MSTSQFSICKITIQLRATFKMSICSQRADVPEKSSHKHCRNILIYVSWRPGTKYFVCKWKKKMRWKFPIMNSTIVVMIATEAGKQTIPVLMETMQTSEEIKINHRSWFTLKRREKKRNLQKKNQTWKACTNSRTNLREYIGMAALLSVCHGFSFLLVLYPKLTPTVLQ